MNSYRRTLLKGAGATGGLAVAFALGLLRPSQAAAAWSDGDFQVEGLDTLMKNVGTIEAGNDDRIKVEVPEIANNGSVVPVTVTSTIPGTESIAILADKNPLPLLGIFEFLDGAQGYASTRVKMRETSAIRAVVKAGDKYYMNERLVKVTIGGCGG
ncbi:MAG: thiosulfate oxidation carrier protein SoxY [Pseudomonadota bacterium]